jgi:hypothetical protein
VALREAEQAQYLLSGGPTALALLGIERQFVDGLALHRQA